MSKIRLAIKLTPKQQEVDSSPARFKIWKAGRRGAKTWYQAFFLAKNAIKMPGTKHWYVTKTLALGREELWPVLLDLLPRDLVRKIDERLLTIWLTNGSSISLKSGEKEDNLRGRGLGSVVLDEAAFLKGALWDTILRPQLAGSMGPALIASSPKKGWFTQLFNKVVKEPDANWAAFHSTIYDNPHISKDEIEVIKAKTPVNTWLQEYMAEEVSEDGQVYDEFSPVNIYNPSEMFQDVRTFKTFRGLDWGVSDPTACVWVGISPDGYLVISDEHEHKGWDPARHAEIIHTKSSGFSAILGSVLDGSAFRKESSLISVADQFRDAGIMCQRSEKDVQASLGIMKRFIRGNGKPWLYVSAKCSRLITAFQEWEHGDHEPDVLAAARYAAVWVVTRGMTRLADAIPSAPQRPVKQEDARLILGAQARLVRSTKPSAWSWNYDTGVPS